MVNFVLAAAIVLIGAAVAQPALSVATPALDARTNSSCSLLQRWNCVAPTVSTKIGSAKGALEDGAARFPVKYAKADRWKASSVAEKWELPNGSADVTAMPLPCPQPGVDAYSEDCLSMVLYVPATSILSPSLPVLVWIHGGSFYTGSASAPGLDGAKLAQATNSVVAVIQYRLGAFGFMAPDGTTNLALKDVITALTFLKSHASSFGGDVSKITVSGQSSGANMIRALLATPSASGLYQSAILHSDPMNYGFLSPSTQETLLDYFASEVSCYDSSCFNKPSVKNILDAQTALLADAYSLDASTGAGEPIRPVHDGKLITTTLTSSTSFPSQSKPILLFTVQNEATETIYSQFDSPVTASIFNSALNASLGTARSSTLIASPYYTASNGETDARPRLEKFGTDFTWRCPTWTFAREWASSGGTAWVGLFTLGEVYPTTTLEECSTNGVVCHQADIEIVFGTVNNPSDAQEALIIEVQSRYKAFLHDGTPNAGGQRNWEEVRGDDVNVLNFGGDAEVEIGACDVSFWGEDVAYDYQLFKL
ncbi:alpha/beta-hydrolase [Cylindrobasidium torrendii FP15055 ss-10]|uniref:Carboxylic ester hydrolase n=1 Tax=Cylindrobasidium torrendii FP15055 ss-10 TaxID=1314674 RepID=A0A0D7B7W3_9AGAR|nr:alpha/beta-hydrolase [Cylindrobasidium torrendii FP15055 ss-10]